MESKELSARSNKYRHLESDYNKFQPISSQNKHRVKLDDYTASVAMSEGVLEEFPAEPYTL